MSDETTISDRVAARRAAGSWRTPASFAAAHGSGPAAYGIGHLRAHSDAFSESYHLRSTRALTSWYDYAHATEHDWHGNLIPVTGAHSHTDHRGDADAGPATDDGMAVLEG